MLISTNFMAQHRRMPISCSENPPGLSTYEALGRLHDDIETALQECEESQSKINKSFGPKSVISEAFHRKSMISVFRWTSALALIVEGVLLLVAYGSCNDPRYQYLPYEAFYIFVVTAFNVYLVWWDTHLRHSEVPSLARRILSSLREYRSVVMWSQENYPHLHSPLSPCITLQWTRRDANTVNLPWTLLTRGDIILLRPGQKVPARCRPWLETSGGGNTAELHMGDIYSPSLDGVGEGFSSPKARAPLRDEPYIVMETPYITNLKICLEEALNRPVTVFNKQRYMLFSTTMEAIICPLVFVLILIINIIHLNYGLWTGDWTEAVLVSPVSAALPLIPMGLPLAWMFLNWLGIAKILSMYQQSNNMKDASEDPFEDPELEALQLSEIAVKWDLFRQQFLKTLWGKQPSPVRTANLLHVLASVTNLCCVDKKGILSWPNPTAEKVFFLMNRGHEVITRTNMFSSGTSLYAEEDIYQENRNDQVFSAQPAKESESVLMSLTHDRQTAFGLQFDDMHWRRYLPSLKPLGLNILLNTCNPQTQDHYTRFCSHITCEAMYNEDLVPVSQRRCLCELAKQIGFSEQAMKPFVLEHQLSTFRHVPPDMACKDRLAKSLMVTKLKFPFPHMVSVLMRDKSSHKLELMSQGTADIILDSCTDYWDGVDICPLTEKDRKKILDFYHRTSLSAYCTAFSYRPTSCVVHSDLTNLYMELPIDPTHLYRAARTPTPHISTEALFGDDDHTEYEEIEDIDDCFRMQCKQIFIGMVTMQYQAKADMVQMIEQLDASCIRFIHFSKENELRSRVFSEKMGLESGWNCHISLLSDRTRTESGNSSRAGAAPHATARASGTALNRQSTEDVNGTDLGKSRFRSSLEVSRALSHSAPSAINLEVAQVKFDDEVSVCSGSSSQPTYEEEDQSRLEGNDWGCDGSEECVMLADNGDHEERSRSPSRITESTEHSASFNFDMSNRARLPKGIENIRPHLENVDNVPLLVSLFTDCTPLATRSMLTIMQDYTEVTIVTGSSANAENMRLFMQADASISLEPLYPQVCMRVPVYVKPPPEKGITPAEMAKKLNSMPCSLAFHRDDKVSLVHLIMESRHYMQHMMSCFQFWACCSLSITLLQLLTAAAALPPLLSSGDVLWLINVVIPLLSLSLVGAPTNPSVMNQATGKNSAMISKEVLRYIFLYYGSKFLPSIFVVLLCGGLTMTHFCHVFASSTNTTCTYVYPDSIKVVNVINNSSTYTTDYAWKGWGDQNAYSLITIQNSVAFLLVLYFGIISASFVHRMYQLWKRNPFKNKLWAVTLVAVLTLQIIYASTAASLWSSRLGRLHYDPNYWDIPLWVWAIAFVWPLLLVPINEGIKRVEIGVNVRYQKRARLEFGTKLGMNSPF